MIKCPFCHFDNEDRALFCERCTSDLTGVAPTPSPAKASPPPPPMAAPLPAMPMAEAVPVFAEAVPLEAIPMAVEAMPYEATPMVAEAIPYEPPAAMPALHAEPFHPAMPAEPFAAIPLELQTVHQPPAAMPATPAVAESAPPLAPAIPVAMPAAPAPAPVAAAPAPAAPASAPPAAAPEAAAGAPTGFMPPGAQPRLLVLRGQKRNVEYPIFEGPNFLGRADEKPVDIDLEEQEPPDRVWCSRQHACIHWEDNQLLVEDLNSANGTYVNRTRVYPGQKRALSVNDIVQIGNVQLKVVV